MQLRTGAQGTRPWTGDAAGEKGTVKTGKKPGKTQRLRGHSVHFVEESKVNDYHLNLDGMFLFCACFDFLKLCFLVAVSVLNGRGCGTLE